MNSVSLERFVVLAEKWRAAELCTARCLLSLRTKIPSCAGTRSTVCMICWIRCSERLRVQNLSCQASNVGLHYPTLPSVVPSIRDPVRVFYAWPLVARPCHPLLLPFSGTLSVFFMPGHFLGSLYIYPLSPLRSPIRRPSRREAQGYQDPLAEHAHRSRDDRLHRRYLQRCVAFGCCGLVYRRPKPVGQMRFMPGCYPCRWERDENSFVIHILPCYTSVCVSRPI